VVSELDQRVKEANDRVLESLPRTRAAEDAQQAWQRRVLERAAAAAQELRLREQGLFNDPVVDPPEHLLQALGPPPADLASWQIWWAEALQLERARAAGLTVEGVASPAVPSVELSVQHKEIPQGDAAALPGSGRMAADPAPFHVHLEDGVAVVDQDAKMMATGDGPEPMIDLPE
jgi:hypothetical protein